jgi:hypothetical protein
MRRYSAGRESSAASEQCGMGLAGPSSAARRDVSRAQRIESGWDVPSPEAVIDLLGALSYGELCAFDRLAHDARLAPTLAGRAQMSTMAALELSHYQALATRLSQLGADVNVAMLPFVSPLETYHALTAPSTWLEGVVKAYVGDGIAEDFYREVATFVDDATRELIDSVLSDTGRAEFAVREVRAAIVAQPAVAGRLALWARRLVGEAISQTQHVLADRDPLMMLLMEGTGDLSGVAALLSRITQRHEQRMASLGLST